MAKCEEDAKRKVYACGQAEAFQCVAADRSEEKLKACYGKNNPEKLDEKGAIKDERKLWYLDGKAYDLTEFLPNHPGGGLYLAFHGRDISIVFNTYHKNPKNNKKLIDKLLVKDAPALPPAAHLPASALVLLAPGFDASRDIVSYNFDPDDRGLFLNECRRRVLDAAVQNKIKELDRSFDITTAAIGAIYLCFLVAWLRSGVAGYVITVAFPVLKTALAGAGHYQMHRARPNFWDCLFDLNYVGTALTAVDGHNIGHHSHSLTQADPKAGFFGGMCAVPRLWRVPIFTLHKLGHFLAGILLKGVEVHTFPDSPLRQFPHLRTKDGQRAVQRVVWNFWLVRMFMLTECVLAWRCDQLGIWFAQFFVTLWINTLLVVSSHDFEKAAQQPENVRDWGMYQLINSLDLKVIGNPYIDCFLSAGLSPHRAHHMYPYQKKWLG